MVLALVSCSKPSPAFYDPQFVSLLLTYFRVVCQVYVMEIVPNKIRGGMITLQFVW